MDNVEKQKKRYPDLKKLDPLWVLYPGPISVDMSNIRELAAWAFDQIVQARDRNFLKDAEIARITSLLAELQDKLVHTHSRMLNHIHARRDRYYDEEGYTRCGVCSKWMTPVEPKYFWARGVVTCVECGGPQAKEMDNAESVESPYV